MPNVAVRVLEHVREQRKLIHEMEQRHAEVIRAHETNKLHLEQYQNDLERDLKTLPGVTENEDGWLIFPCKDLLAIRQSIIEDKLSTDYDRIGRQWYTRYMLQFHWWWAALAVEPRSHDRFILMTADDDAAIEGFENNITATIQSAMSRGCQEGYEERYALWEMEEQLEIPTAPSSKLRRLIRSNEDEDTCQ